jgi:hypothetical protein
MQFGSLGGVDPRYSLALWGESILKKQWQSGGCDLCAAPPPHNPVVWISWRRHARSQICCVARMSISLHGCMPAWQHHADFPAMTLSARLSLISQFLYS